MLHLQEADTLQHKENKHEHRGTSQGSNKGKMQLNIKEQYTNKENIQWIQENNTCTQVTPHNEHFRLGTH